MKLETFEFDLGCQSDCLDCGERFEEGQEVVEDDGERFCKQCAPKYFTPNELREIGL